MVPRGDGIQTMTAASFINYSIEIKTDRKGRRFAQYFSMKCLRWFRMPLDVAELALAMQAAAQ
jgi:hypothetical protein